MTNELFRSMFFAVACTSLAVSIWTLSAMLSIKESVEEIKPQVEYCVWHHPASKMYAAHTTSVVKHTKMAEKMTRRFGRPSDEGGCGNATK